MVFLGCFTLSLFLLHCFPWWRVGSSCPWQQVRDDISFTVYFCSVWEMLFVYYKCSYLSNCLHENFQVIKPLWCSFRTILEIYSFQKTIIQVIMTNAFFVTWSSYEPSFKVHYLCFNREIFMEFDSFPTSSQKKENIPWVATTPLLSMIQGLMVCFLFFFPLQ